MLNSLFSAFLMYSRLPVPKVEWKEENRRYSLGFFPLVGAVIGVALLGWHWLARRLNLNPFLLGTVSALIPVAVTGGIHLDGFCDVSDALASFGDKDKKLSIMSDPHIGSFALIRLCVCMMMFSAILSQLSRETAAVYACVFVLSRSLSGLSAVSMRAAKSTGALQSFVQPAQRWTVITMEALFIAISGTLMIVLGGLPGACAIVAAAAVLWYCKSVAYRNFGGISGDVCGWFLVLCEVWSCAAAVFSEKILEVLR